MTFQATGCSIIYKTCLNKNKKVLITSDFYFKTFVTLYHKGKTKKSKEEVKKDIIRSIIREKDTK